MVVLKKVKSATLIEALVATVLIVIIFVIASLVLNNLVLNTFSRNTHPVETRLNELEYEIQNSKLQLPYEETYKDWDISIKVETKSSVDELLIVANKLKSNKEIIRQRSYEKK